MLLPGGQVTLPLNPDSFTVYVYIMINTPAFSNFWSTLDGEGRALAQINTASFVPISPHLIGIYIYFAYALSNPWDFVSNPVLVEVVE